MASGKPLRPSIARQWFECTPWERTLSKRAMRMSSTPLFFRLFLMDSQNLAPSLAATRVWPLRISSGSKLPFRSRGMSMGTAPSLPFKTLRVAPLRRFDCWLTGPPCGSKPRCSVNSAPAFGPSNGASVPSSDPCRPANLQVVQRR